MAYIKKPKAEWKETPLRKNCDVAGGVICKGCFERDRRLEEIRDENKRLKLKIAQLDKKVTRKDLPDPHTPSSKIDFKKNSKEKSRMLRGGAKAGHEGHGRKQVKEVSQVVCHEVEDRCCVDCGGELIGRGIRNRTVIEVERIKAKPIRHEIHRYQCRSCSRWSEAKTGLSPQILYGNRLLAQAATLHFSQGIPLGRLVEIYGGHVTQGGLIQALHRMGKMCESSRIKLIEQYRNEPVRHADETGWRTDGHSGYAWIFRTEKTTILDFADSRAARVAKDILGNTALDGVLVVDRYGGYNKMMVNLQYCFAHLLREVEDLQDEYGGNKGVTQFTNKLIPLLSEAMKLQSMNISDEDYYNRSRLIKNEIKGLMNKMYSHVGVKRIQQIFRDKEHRLYHWVEDRRVPPDNNRAERELRPTVIARKTSFGSQSEKGARTRSNIMSVLLTAQKRLPPGVALEDWLEESLNQIALNPDLTLLDLMPSPDI